ncbi:MAG: exodeoxyribonuclease VII small subunit [Chloroflexi bacterium]|nr:exodeoxyribonuclease VII small subunit [Chloroflexota bacterium]
MPKSKDKSESFENLFSELESTVAKLEAGDLSLDESLALFQRGMELAKKCGAMLDAAELRIKQLVPQGDQVVMEDVEEE